MLNIFLFCECLKESLCDNNWNLSAFKSTNIFHNIITQCDTLVYLPINYLKEHKLLTKIFVKCLRWEKLAFVKFIDELRSEIFHSCTRSLTREEQISPARSSMMQSSTLWVKVRGDSRLAESLRRRHVELGDVTTTQWERIGVIEIFYRCRSFVRSLTRWVRRLFTFTQVWHG